MSSSDAVDCSHALAGIAETLKRGGEALDDAAAGWNEVGNFADVEFGQG